MKRILCVALVFCLLSAVVWAAEKPAPPKSPNADRIAELQKTYQDVCSEIDRLTVMKHQLEGGMAELQRLDKLAAEKAAKEQAKPAPTK